jgi:hypothetical protein
MSPLLLPPSFTNGTRSVMEQLNERLGQAEAVRACICYWTQWPEQLHPNFIALLAKEPSFCCVDVHWPTDPEALVEFGQLGAMHFYLFLKQLVLPRKLQVRHNLMHTKMLVLDLPYGQAEIWVGSHNFTDYALGGTNFEASVVTQCEQNSDFYRQCRGYLEYMREQCHPFDSRLLAEYKALQRTSLSSNEGEIYQVLPVLGSRVDQLAGKTLLLLGDDAQELKKFGATAPARQRLLVRAGDLDTQRDYLIDAHVQSSGLIDRLDQQSFGIDFSERPYAIRRNQLIPYTAYRDKAYGGEDLKEFAYWVNVKLGEIVGKGDELQSVNAPPIAWWAKDAAATTAIRTEMARVQDDSSQITPAVDLPSRERGLQELKRRREKRLEVPEIRVARFRAHAERAKDALLLSVDEAFEAPMLTSAQPFYDEQFQQVYFERITEQSVPGSAEREGPKAPEKLKALRQKTLVQERRWKP